MNKNFHLSILIAFFKIIKILDAYTHSTNWIGNTVSENVQILLRT